MKGNAHKIFWGLLLLFAAVALVFYGIGDEIDLLGLPIYKMILGLILVSWIISKVLFSESLRQRFKIFFPLAFLFMLFEPEIADYLRYPDENIINNWLLLLAALLANIAITIIIPKKHKHHGTQGFGRADGFNKNCFSDSTIYIDASKTTKSYVKNTLGETNVYYQNVDQALPDTVYELTIENCLGETCVHVPSDWVIKDEMTCALGEINTRKNPQGEVKLIIRGKNNLGETNIL